MTSLLINQEPYVSEFSPQSEVNEEEANFLYGESSMEMNDTDQKCLKEEAGDSNSEYSEDPKEVQFKNKLNENATILTHRKGDDTNKTPSTDFNVTNGDCQAENQGNSWHSRENSTRESCNDPKHSTYDNGSSEDCCYERNNDLKLTTEHGSSVEKQNHDDKSDCSHHSHTESDSIENSPTLQDKTNDETLIENGPESPLPYDPLDCTIPVPTTEDETDVNESQNQKEQQPVSPEPRPSSVPKLIARHKVVADVHAPDEKSSVGILSSSNPTDESSTPGATTPFHTLDKPVTLPGVRITAATPSSSSSSNTGIPGDIPPYKFSKNPPSKPDSPRSALRKSKKKRSSRQNATVVGVTNEARIVLENFLKRSLSQSDASPLQQEYQAIEELDVIEEFNKKQDSSKIDSPSAYQRNQSYIRSQESYQSDGESSHSPISSSSRETSMKHQIRPKTDQDVRDAMREAPKSKKKKKRRRLTKKKRRDSTSSSSSDEDAINVGNIFKKLRQSFRLTKDEIQPSSRYLHKDGKKQESGESTTERIPPKRKTSFLQSFRKHDRTKSADMSPLYVTAQGPTEPRSLETPDSEIVRDIHTKTNIHVHQDSVDGRYHGPLIYEETDTEQRIEDRAKGGNIDHQIKVKLKSKKSFPTQKPKKQKKNKGLFERFLQQLRKGSDFFKAKEKEDHPPPRSVSADQFKIRYEKERVDEEGRTSSHTFREVIRPADGEYVDSPLRRPEHQLLPSLSPHSLAGNLAPREHLKLDGLVKFPAEQGYDLSYEIKRHDQITEDGTIRTLDYEEKARVIPYEYDEIDYGTHLIPHHLRTAEQKDEMYEKLANQLVAIADHYEKSPKTPLPSMEDAVYGSDSEGLYGVIKPPSSVGSGVEYRSLQGLSDGEAIPTESQPEIQKQIAAILRAKGDENAPKIDSEMQPLVHDIIRNASYSHFKSVINGQTGGDPSWEKLALVFQLTTSAVRLAGMGTAIAGQIKDMTLKYFEDGFANWVIDQGGWESMVEDHNNLSSELD